MNLKQKISFILLVLTLPNFILNFGSVCKQIINEHFFDLNPIESPDDYYFPFKDSEKTNQVYFNFCTPVHHSCPGTTPEYHMMIISDQNCMYYRPIDEDDQLGTENEGNLIYLISETGGRVSEGVPADGISSLFQDIAGSKNFIKLNMFCNPLKSVPSFRSETIGDFQGGTLLTLNYECSASCPQKMSVMFYNVLDDIKWVLFVLGLLIGPLELLLGFKLFRLTLIIVSLLTVVILYYGLHLF